MYTENDIIKIKDIILQNMPDAEKIILFGSYARGNATETSDLDYLIVTRNNLDRKLRLSSLAAIRWKSARAGYKTDFLLKSKTDFLHDITEPTLSKIIANEGRVLWQTN